MSELSSRTLELVNTVIDARAEAGAELWREDVAKLVQEATTEWHRENSEVDQDIFDDLYQPALLWRFYTHLAHQLLQIGCGWEQIFYQNLKERK